MCPARSSIDGPYCRPSDLEREWAARDPGSASRCAGACPLSVGRISTRGSAALHACDGRAVLPDATAAAHVVRGRGMNIARRRHRTRRYASPVTVRVCRRTRVCNGSAFWAHRRATCARRRVASARKKIATTASARQRTSNAAGVDDSMRATARRRSRAARNWWPFTLAHLTEFDTLAMNKCANMDAGQCAKRTRSMHVNRGDNNSV